MIESLLPLPQVLFLALALATVSDDPPPPPPPPEPPAVMRDPSVGRMDPPVYPPDENCRGIGGEVLLDLGYDRSGAVVDVRVIRSTGSRTLDRAAITAARGWTVNPATRDGLPIEGRVNVPVRFEPAPDPVCGRPIVEVEAAPGRIAPTDTPVLRLGFAPSESARSPLEVRWSRHGERGAEVVQHGELPVPAGPGSLVFEWKHAQPLAAGQYSVEVRQSRDVLAYLMFEVAAP